MSLSRFVLNSLLAIILPLMGSVVVFAQYTTATLSGTVSDSSGAVVGDAKISVQNIETGLHRETQSGSNGAFTFTALPVGKYQLTAEKPGFSKYLQSGITLALDQSANVPVQLKVGDISQQVTVSADAELVQRIALCCTARE